MRRKAVTAKLSDPEMSPGRESLGWKGPWSSSCSRRVWSSLGQWKMSLPTHTMILSAVVAVCSSTNPGKPRRCQVYFTQDKFKLLHRMEYLQHCRHAPAHRECFPGGWEGVQHTCIIMEFTIVSKALEREINYY